jgi:DNA polymerase
LTKATPPAPAGAGEELRDIAGQAADYLLWLKDEGLHQVEVAVPVIPSGVASDLARVAGVIAGCRKCSLHQTRTRTVPGQGNPAPEILFVGEAPGADEDEQGLAFVGRAGQLLTKMIQAMGFERDEVFIANILKCRPPDNRAPLPEEMETCLPYLKEQIRLLKPKVIVALGATAVRGLVGLEGISKLRGNWLQFEGIDLMPTYHPAYLLRNPPAKKDVWLDLQEALRRLGRTPPKARSQG